MQANTGERFERTSEATARLLGRTRNSLELALSASKQGDQQVGLAQRIGSQNDRFRLLQGHEMLPDVTRFPQLPNSGNCRPPTEDRQERTRRDVACETSRNRRLRWVERTTTP